MEGRNVDIKFVAPSRAEIEARVREAEQQRAEILAQGVKWVLRQIGAGLHWLVGLEWKDAERLRQEQLKLRFARASSPAHIHPEAPEVPVRLDTANARRAQRRPSREDRKHAA